MAMVAMAMDAVAMGGIVAALAGDAVAVGGIAIDFRDFCGVCHVSKRWQCDTWRPTEARGVVWSHSAHLEMYHNSRFDRSRWTFTDVHDFHMLSLEICEDNRKSTDA